MDTESIARKDPREPSKTILRDRVLPALPAFLVLSLLAAIGCWGHLAGWTFPAFSELIGREDPAVEAWCDAHGVPESICVSCKADLMPKGELRGWCKEHGVAECVLEHPGLAQLGRTPVITPDDLDRAARALAIRLRPENDPLCKLHLRRIQFATRDAADKAGIDIALVERGPIVETVEANGQIRYDPTRVTRLASRSAGVVWRVDKKIGDSVQEGELMALIDAAPVGQAKAELLDAVAQLQLQDATFGRMKGLDGVVAGRRLQEVEAARQTAEAAVRKAIQTLANLGLPVDIDDVRGKTGDVLAAELQFLGLPRSIARQLDSQQSPATLTPVLSPRDGVVVARDIVAGEVVRAAQTLMTVVDPRRMWLLLDVPLEEANHVSTGQKVIFRPDGSSRQHVGQVTWISTHVDAQTRTVEVRAELPNENGALRDEGFGAGKIVIREEEQAIIVPSDAIHWEGCCHVAFVRDRDYMTEGAYRVFHTRMVRPGVTEGNHTELIAGLLPGEVVVTQGSGVLRAELLKGNLGAG